MQGKCGCQIRGRILIIKILDLIRYRHVNHECILLMGLGLGDHRCRCGFRWKDLHLREVRKMKLYQDLDDWWIGYYRGPNYNYVCLIPTIVIRWRRR